MKKATIEKKIDSLMGGLTVYSDKILVLDVTDASHLDTLIKVGKLAKKLKGMK